MIVASDSITPLSVWILAGGQSSRMGQDKALLEWEGIALITRMCQIAQTLSPVVQVLSPWPDRYRSRLPEGVKVVQESTNGQGPLWALAQALAQTQTEWLLLLACDMPLLEVSRLQVWRSHLRDLQPTCTAYVPQTQSLEPKRWEPLCGFFRRDSLTQLTAFLNKDGRSFQHWLAQIGACPIPLTTEEEPMFFNCNTLQDWSVLEKQAPPSPFA